MSNWGLASASAVATAPLTALVVPNATAHTKGAWSQMYSSTPVGVCGMTITILESLSQIFPRLLLDIGIGSVGSEVVVAANIPIATVDNFREAGKSVYLPIAIPAGQRLVARLQSAEANSGNIRIEIALQVGTPMTPISGGLLQSYGVTLASTKGTFIVAGASYSWGTGTLFTTTPYRARAISITMFGSNEASDGYFVGARAVYGTTSIVASPTFTGCIYALEAKGSQPLLQLVPCDIPAGTQINIQTRNIDVWTPTRAWILHLLH